jgi:hypothetical protein
MNDPRRSGIVLGYGAIATSKIDEGLTRLLRGRDQLLLFAALRRVLLRLLRLFPVTGALGHDFLLIVMSDGNAAEGRKQKEESRRQKAGADSCVSADDRMEMRLVLNLSNQRDDFDTIRVFRQRGGPSSGGLPRFSHDGS